jgi:hypothetical protein
MYMHIYVHICMYICIYICIYIHACVVCVHACVCVCIDVDACEFVYIFIYIYIYTHVYPPCVVPVGPRSAARWFDWFGSQKSRSEPVRTGSNRFDRAFWLGGPFWASFGACLAAAGRRRRPRQRALRLSQPRVRRQAVSKAL